MDHGRAVNKIFQSKPEGRNMGRPRLRWLKAVGKDLWEMMAKRWRQQAVYMEEWVSVIKEAKALRRPYSQGVVIFHVIKRCDIRGLEL